MKTLTVIPIVIVTLLRPGGPQPALGPPLDAASVWGVTRGKGVTIGTIDTGFDFHHPALKGRLEPGYFAPGVFHTHASSVIAHGTAVVSVIGARVTPEMAGMAPDATLLAAAQGMPEHVLLRLRAEAGRSPDRSLERLLVERRDDVQRFLTAWVTHVAQSTADGLSYLVNRGAKVVAIPQFLPLNQLQKFPAAMSALEAAFARAQAHDVVIVLGAGNDDARVEAYPGRAENVLVVGAADREGRRWVEHRTVGGREIRQGTNTGPRLSVLAPAFDLMVARPHDPGSYSLDDSPVGAVNETFDAAYSRQETGATSLATAVAAGAAGLVRSAAPELSAAATIDVILRTARDIGVPGRDDESGYGVIDLKAAIDRAIGTRAGDVLMTLTLLTARHQKGR